jgi:hypothetical protein
MHKKDGMLDELVRAAIAEDAENEAQMSGTEHDARTPRCVPAGVPLLDYTLDRLLHAIAGPDQLFGAVMSVRSLNEWACGMGREAHGLTAAPEPLQPAPTPEQALQTCAKAPEPLALGDSACSVPTLVGVYEDVLLVESGQRLDGLLPEAAAPVPDEQAVPQGMPQEWEVLDDAAWPEDAEAQEALRAGCEGSPDHDDTELPAIEPPAARAAGLELTDDEPPAGSSDRAAVLRQRMSLLAGKAKLHTALGLESPTGWRARWNGGLVAVDAADPRFQRLVVCVFAMPDPPSFRAVAAALDDAGVHDLRPVLAALKSSPGVKSISRKDCACLACAPVSAADAAATQPLQARSPRRCATSRMSCMPLAVAGRSRRLRAHRAHRLHRARQAYCPAPTCRTRCAMLCSKRCVAARPRCRACASLLSMPCSCIEARRLSPAGAPWRRSTPAAAAGRMRSFCQLSRMQLGWAALPCAPGPRNRAGAGRSSWKKLCA